MKKRGRFTLGQLLLSAVMVLLALTMLIPMLNILAKSFSDPALSPSMSGLRVIPAGFSTVNYDIVFSNKVILPTLWNSIFITVVGTAINILLTTSAAYVLIQPGLMFKKIIMTFLIVMMLFDPGLVPEYLLVKQLGLIGSQWSVILVTSVNVYYLIIMMRYFQAVPMDIYEAARIDGAGEFRTFFRIVLPLSKPGLATIGMFTTIAYWNDWFLGMLYIVDQKKYPVQTLLWSMQNSLEFMKQSSANALEYAEMASNAPTDSGRMALTVLVVLPILLAYPFFQ